MYSDEGYRALTTNAGVVVRRDRGVIRVAGPDRAVWLQGLLTNDVETIGPGEARYAAYLTPQGRMISDMRVVGEGDALLLDVPAPLSGTLRDRMDGLVFAEDVQVTDVSGATVPIEVLGPASASVVARAAERGALADATVVAVDEMGVASTAVYAAGDRVASSVRALIEAGAADVSLETLEVLRVEAGVPRFLADMTEETIPLEAGIEHRAISFTKGCYVGQEIIVRVMHRGGGRVARRLVGLSFAGADAASPGDSVLADGRVQGRVTSAVWSPALGHAIALGYVHRDLAAPGTAVEVGTDDRRVSATVTALPFVARSA